MKIYITSDLHLGVSPRGDQCVGGMARFLEKNTTSDDVLLILGDIATDDEHVKECLALFRDFPGKKAAIAGNHDVWVKPNTVTSLERYQALPTLFKEAGFHPLQEEPFVQGQVGFVGALGWYDYSFRDPRLHIPWETYVSKPGWTDRQYARWHMTDLEVVEQQLFELEAHLAYIQERTARAIAVMHHVPTAKLLAFPQARWLVPKRWRYLNAFLGSERFRELLQEYRDVVQTVVCGHIHRSGCASINGQRYYSVGSTYDDKQLLVMEDKKVYRVRFTA